MTVWGIADLHLSFARPDRRDRYSARWRDHAAKIEANWRETVDPADLVLLPGDISMARNHRAVQPDLQWLDRLPGTKILGKGNHDRWFNRVEAVRPLLRRSQRVVDGDAIVERNLVIAGAMGMPVPPEEPDAAASTVIAAQLDSLNQMLAQAASLRTAGEPLILLWHYPPFDTYGRPGPWVPLFEQAGVTACVYGHLHREGQWSGAVQGVHGGVRYACVAADAIGFRPLRIMDCPETPARGPTVADKPGRPPSG